MALNTQLSIAARNACLNAGGLCAQFNAGFLKVFSGAQPANADAATTGTLLATLTFGSPAFGTVAASLATANAITSDSNAPNTGTAGYCRCFKSDGTTVLMDGSVGTSNANVVLNTLAITAHMVVNATTFSLTALGPGA